MATWQERKQAALTGSIVDIHVAAEQLRRHSTVRSNPKLLEPVETILAQSKTAALLTSILWYRGERPSEPEAA